MKIPGYEIEKEIGRGGMASVYLAVHHNMHRQVALKILSEHQISDTTMRDRFLKEKDIVAHLDHPNIVIVYDFGIHEDIYYLSMQYLPGGSLDDLLKTEVPLQRTLEIITAIGKALDYAHRHDCIHRDIKPQNILFKEDGTPVLTDFGIARQLLDDSTQLTVLGSLIGTPHYMSPEQFKEQEVDTRTDLYSIGILFYKMLTGSLPYEANSLVALAQKHCYADIPKLPAEVSKFQPSIDKLLAKEPSRRYANASEFLQALESIKAGFQQPDDWDNTVIDKGIPVEHWGRVPGDDRNGDLEDSSATQLDRDNSVVQKHDKAKQIRSELPQSQQDTEVIPGIILDSRPRTQREPGPDNVGSTTIEKEGSKKAWLVTGLFLLIFVSIVIFLFKDLIIPAKIPGPVVKEAEDVVVVDPVVKEAEDVVVADPVVKEAEDVVVADPVVKEAEDVVVADPMVKEAEDVVVADPVVKEAEDVVVVDPVVKKDAIDEITRIKKFRDKLSNGLEGPELIVLPAGELHTVSFMGEAGQDKPIYKINAFSMSIHEITVGQFEIFVESSDYDNQADFDKGCIYRFADGYTVPEKLSNGEKLSWRTPGFLQEKTHPVVCVSLDDARAFTTWLSQQSKQTYRLPTEAEWEYAARGKHQDNDYWAVPEQACEFANFADQGFQRLVLKESSSRCNDGSTFTAPVSSYKANNFELRDMLGNVAEWTCSTYAGNHDSNLGCHYESNPRTAYAVRGGAWWSPVDKVNISLRRKVPENARINVIGFRVVREVTENIHVESTTMAENK